MSHPSFTPRRARQAPVVGLEPVREMNRLHPHPPVAKAARSLEPPAAFPARTESHRSAAESPDHSAKERSPAERHPQACSTDSTPAAVRWEPHHRKMEDIRHGPNPRQALRPARSDHGPSPRERSRFRRNPAPPSNSSDRRKSPSSACSAAAACPHPRHPSDVW